MFIKYIPVVPYDDKRIEYTFDDEKVTAQLNGKTDTFDFSKITNRLEREKVRTALDVNPIVSAVRDRHNDLRVTLVKYVSADASQEERNTDEFEVK